MKISRRSLTWLYPRAWRERYGDEFASLLDATPVSLRLILDVGLAAGKQWLLHPVGLLVLAPSVAYAATAVAGYLFQTFPVEPAAYVAGRINWAPWYAYLGLPSLVLFVLAPLRGGLPSRLGYRGIPVLDALERGSVNGLELACWVALFFVSSVGNQFADMAGWPGVEATLALDTWRSDASMMVVAFIVLRINSVLPHKTVVAEPPRPSRLG